MVTWVSGRPLRETAIRRKILTGPRSDPGDQAPTLSSEMLRCAKEYVDFQLSSTPSEVIPTTWTQAMSLGDRLVTACHHSVALATVALRRTYDPGGLVPERDLASMESFLDLEVLPKELAEVKRDRAYHGVPSYFETPPSRQGPDSIQPSRRDHAVEGLNSIWEEYKTGKLLLISCTYREEFQSTLPNSPLARVPKHERR